MNLNKRQRLRHFLNHKGIRSRFKCTSQSCAYTQTQSAQMKVTETTKVLLIKVNNNNTGLAYNHIQKNLRCLVKGDVLQVPIDLKHLIQ
ncbi:hypothetical protein [Lacticaseibacillus paracasei]|uniref:hypothetical protein n=2 Tax=Lacticaseibacillus paracasei TaxID=1597 RepID=UPI001EFFA6D6|nr:hypothetical protein [Lacticaseibacillus paracasei]